MQLTIKNNKNISIDKFITFLIDKIQRYFIQNIDKLQLIRFDNYIESNKENFIVEKTARKFITYNLLIATIYNLKAEKQGKDVVIRIESNQVIPYMKLTFNAFARLINDGNSQLVGYNIFDKTFKYFANHLEEYYNEFLYGGN